jgi:ribosomal protein L40E
MGLRDYLGGLVRRKTPQPLSKDVYNLGIQEKRNVQHIIGPVLYDVANQSTIVRTCITQLKTEIFRRGYEWEKAFYKTCEDCNTKHEKETENCRNCGSTNLRLPSNDQKVYAEKFFEGYVNKSEQKFIDVLKQLESDLNIADDAYLILVKEYYLDNENNVALHKIKEVYRGDPLTMYIDVDEEGDRGEAHFTCLTHRDVYDADPMARCPECGGKLQPVHYVNRVAGKNQYFVKGEVMHMSKYNPSRLYGMSPILTLWSHITTLIAMENYVNTSYTKARAPRGILAVQTNNMESLVKYWKGVKEKLEKDPHYIPIMGIETDGGSKGSIEWVQFMNTLKEMDYINVKDDLRDRIGAFYGVSKIFQGDTSTSGGLNNEGMQILVTNRSVELAQNVYNQYLFPFLLKQFGITDWNLNLLRSEEEDNVAELRRREIEINLATQIKNLGFEVDMDEDGNFIYSKPQPKEPEGGKPQEGNGEEGKLETDPYAGTDIDASQLGQLQEQQLMGQQGGSEAPKTRNKPSMSVGPPNRNSGLPKEAANNNVDRRTERGGI